jgi:hypothetical protein
VTAENRVLASQIFGWKENYINLRLKEGKELKTELSNMSMVSMVKATPKMLELAENFSLREI